MILKSKGHKHKSYGKLVRYIRNEAKTKSKEAFLLTRYVRGDRNETQNIINHFIKNETRRKSQVKSNSIFMHHDIISYSRKSFESLSEEKLRKVAMTYLKERCPKTLAVVSLHKDKQWHLHFMYAPHTIEGVTNRITRQRFKECKQKVQSLERSLEITGSEIDHSVKKNH